MQPLSTTKPSLILPIFFKALLVIGMVVLFARLAELQIIKGEYYRSLAENNRIRRITITAPRGKILARGGEVLAGNEEVKKTIVFNPETGFEKKEFNSDSSGDSITEFRRTYPLGAAFFHIGGYLAEANEEEVQKVDSRCSEMGVRKLGTLIGRSGLEEQYDCLLRGQDGEELVEVDTFGKKIRTYGRRNPVAGNDLVTTIDFDLQKKIAEYMNGTKGAVVAADSDGQVLALYSSPSVDPSLGFGSALLDEQLPLFNRAVGGLYHPGSVYKLVTAAAAIEEGVINKDFRYEDTGVVKVNEFEYSNWYFTQYGRVEGSIDLTKALARSTDTFFYKVGEMMGIDNLVKWTNIFGLSAKTGIDIPGEVAGLVPSPLWKKAVKGERWFLGNTYHMSIGQGDMIVTPLAANVMTGVFASKGSLCKPHIKQDDRDCVSLNIKQETFSDIEKGLIAACTDGGTAYPFFGFSPQVACKTGTAETSKKDITHAWFTVYAPFENPEIVLTVLAEEGGEGSKVAAPLAYEILNYWFHGRNN